jgi:thioredoxin 1
MIEKYSSCLVLFLIFSICSSAKAISIDLCILVTNYFQSEVPQRPLTLKQVEDLIRNETPDAAVAIEIERRGVNFEVTLELMNEIYLLGAGLKTIQTLSNFIKPPKINESKTGGNHTPPIVKIVESDFDEEVLKSPIPVLVFFCTDIKESCNVTAPAISEIADSYKGKIKVIEIDVRANKIIPENYNAGYLEAPVIALFSGGQEQGRIKGTASKQAVENLIKRPADYNVSKLPHKTNRGELLLSLASILESDFDEEVLKSPIPVLVFFYASFQDAFEPTLQSVVEVAPDYKEKVKIVRVDVLVNRHIASQYDADYNTGPVLVLFNNGKELGRLAGGVSKQAIVNLITKLSAFKTNAVGTVRNILESDFDEEVLKSPIPVLVFFCVSRNDACRLTSPAVAEVAEKYQDKIKVVKVDADLNKNIARKYDAESYYTPVLILFNRKKERDRLTGTASQAALDRMIDKVLKLK